MRFLIAIVALLFAVSCADDPAPAPDAAADVLGLDAEPEGDAEIAVDADPGEDAEPAADGEVGDAEPAVDAEPD